MCAGECSLDSWMSNLERVATVLPRAVSKSHPMSEASGQSVNNPSIAGLHVFAQSAMLVPSVNLLGALSSNGVDLGLDVN